MFRKDVWLTIAITLICVWLGEVLGAHLAAWIAGFIGLVILVVILLRSGEENRSVRFAPSMKEAHETEKAAIEKQTAALILEREQSEARHREREVKIEGYVSEIESLKPHSRTGLHDVEPGPGDDPELVKEAWARYVNRKIALHGPTFGKWKARFR